jgi:FlaA1/EpsC-like NDP-sugar epimerase
MALETLYPELVGVLMADLGGKTDHVANLQVHVKNLEAEIHRLEMVNQDGATEIKTVGRQFERSERQRQRLDEERERLTSDLVKTANACQKLEVECRRLQAEHETHATEIVNLAGFVETQRQQMTRLRLDLYAEKMVGMITRIRLDGHSEIAVYGAGEVGQALILICAEQGIRVRCAIDRNNSLWGTHIEEVPVVSFDTAIEEENDVYAVASFAFTNEISREIRARYEGTSRKPRIYVPYERPRRPSLPSIARDPVVVHR